jgi:hypothetical protein
VWQSDAVGKQLRVGKGRNYQGLSFKIQVLGKGSGKSDSAVMEKLRDGKNWQCRDA